ncbi:MAG TPA: DUF2092 domain-containing protein [Chthoniobacterales bacterium]|nr:DUF2092 domain-containing protein [Chthoniobacterales bacterium]
MRPVALCLLFCGLVTAARAQDVAITNAEALLQQMEAKYAALKSYQDTTVARYRNPDGAAGAQAECKIWFSRPSFFRIDGESRRAPDAPPRREVIWSDGETSRAWSTARAVTNLPKIQLAGSKMFGTYAYHVPTLLNATYGGERRLHQLTAAKLNGEETIDGVVCHRIKGEWLGDPYEVWLGKTDFLVRKIVANYKGYEMEETHRDIVVDQPILKKVFLFAPEKEAAPTG